jgi:hypothetical protein
LLVILPFQQMMQTSPCNLGRLEAADRKAAADLVEDAAHRSVNGAGMLARRLCPNSGAKVLDCFWSSC